MFSVQQKREISEAVQKILRESQKQRNAKAPELKLGKPVRVQRLVRRLLELGYYPVSIECAKGAAQLVDGRWYMPRWGAETLQHVLDSFGNDAVSPNDITDMARFETAFGAGYASAKTEMRLRKAQKNRAKTQRALRRANIRS